MFNTREIPLTNSDRLTIEVVFPQGTTVVDDTPEVAAKMAARKWTVGYSGSHLYVKSIFTDENGKTTTVYLHRDLMDAKPGESVDHINGDTLDNRLSNLRVATLKENAANRGAVPGTKSRFKGVTPIGRRWRAQVKVTTKGATTRPSGQGHLLDAMFDTEIEAALAFDDAVRRLRNPATERFNFPRPGERDLDGNLVPLDAAVAV